MGFGAWPDTSTTSLSCCWLCPGGLASSPSCILILFIVLLADILSHPYHPPACPPWATVFYPSPTSGSSWSCSYTGAGSSCTEYPPLLVSIIVLFLARVFRDEEKCRQKYGAGWESYCSQVTCSRVVGYYSVLCCCLLYCSQVL